MPTVSETIKRLREERGWTQAELGRRVGLDGSSIARREIGRIRVRADERSKFAEAFGMSVADFNEQWWQWSSPCPRCRGVVPILNRTVDGQVAGYEGDASGPGPKHDSVDFGTVSGPMLFSVIVVGDSMQPTLADGDQLILSPVDPSLVGERLVNGKIVFARFTPRHGSGCTLARFYRENPGRIRLQKDNPMYPPIQCDRADLQAIAIAVERRERL